MINCLAQASTASLHFRAITGATRDSRGRIHNGVAYSLQAATRLMQTAVMVGLLMAALFARQAHADPILEQTGLFVGQTAALYTLNISSAGTLSMDLIDYAWPSPLANLTMEIATPTQILGQMSGAGKDTVSLAGPGTYYAYVSGAATSSLGLGAYGLIADFQPLGQPTPVPLPASISLLLGGIAATLWSARRKGRATHDHRLAVAPG